jgi:peptidoglycan/xylan/chitin deacetylase (PgdA/CDA1 family)
MQFVHRSWAQSLPWITAAVLVAGGCGGAGDTHGAGGATASSGAGATGGAGTTGASSASSTSSTTSASSTGSTTSASSTSSTTSASSTSSSSGGVVTQGPSTLPVPPGASNVPRPSGTTEDLVVLPWADFTAAVSYTFDDSQPSQIAHYAELQAVGVPMTFYVSTGNSAEADYDATFTQAVVDGHEIGNHTVHHCQANLTGCSFGTPDATLPPEIDQCTAYIPQHFGQSAVWTGASPFGDTGYDSDASSRFFVYRGVAGGMVAPNDSTNPFDLPCHLAATGETAATFNAATTAAVSARDWQIFLIHTILPTTAVWYNPVQITDVTGTMSYTKSLGDVWIGTVAEVGAYWRGQKTFSAVTPTTSGNDKTWTWTLPMNFPPGKYLRVTVSGGTLTQGGAALPWVSHGYYEVALDAGSLTWSP